MKIQPAGFWETFKKKNKFLYPESFPAIRDFVISDNRIYVQTYKKQNNEEEYVIMDLKGNILKRVFLPNVQKPGFVERMMGIGIKYYSIQSEKLYYLFENKDAEDWELHVTDIK